MVLPSHITVSLFIFPLILIALGSDLGSSYVAKAADFYWVMSFPVGTRVATTSLACTGLASHSAEAILIFLFGSQTKAGMARALFGAGHRSPGVLQIGPVGTDALPSCSAVVYFDVW